MLATKLNLSSLATLEENNLLAAQNPFHTPEYIAYQIDRGFVPWLLFDGNVNTQCLAFMKTGRVRCSLDIPSIPAVSATDKFWADLIAFCRKAGVSDLSINSFNSLGGEIPEVGIERVRKTRREYLLNLNHPDLLKKLSKGHAYRIKKARKLGLEIQRRRDPGAIGKHAQLISASMQRRKERGENVGTSVAVKNLSDLINSRVGEIFCAVLNGEILSSNLVLLSDKTGYSHTMGTSPEGMASGAAHFLISEIASTLKSEGKDKFNLGGTDDPNPESGLVKFKTGFGASVEQIELQSADFRLGNPLVCMARRYFSLIGRKN